MRVVSSIHPLNTQPKSPSPSRLSGRKFLVAFFSSLKEKAFRFGDESISPSVLWCVGNDPKLLIPEGTVEWVVLLEIRVISGCVMLTPVHPRTGDLWKFELYPVASCSRQYIRLRHAHASTS